MCVDKVLKLTAGSQWAVAQGCDYVIFNDADDLVSNQIGGFVVDHHGENGWYCSSQLFYTYGGRMMRCVDIEGTGVGPCVIVRADTVHLGMSRLGAGRGRVELSEDAKPPR
jgi:hypothetical protein